MQVLYYNFIDDHENRDNQRKLFRASKRLFNHSHGGSLPTNLHAPTFINKKNETMQRKLNTNATFADPPASSTATSATERVPLLTAFKILCASDCSAVCQLDPAPSRLVSKCAVMLCSRSSATFCKYVITNWSLPRMLEGGFG